MTPQQTPIDSSSQTAGNPEALNELITKLVNPMSADETLTISINAGQLLLTADITPIVTKGTLTIGPDDGVPTVTVDGNNQYRGFVVTSGTVTLKNMVIKNMFSEAASGCMAAGAGLFVANVSTANAKPPAYTYSDETPIDKSASVHLINVSFEHCQVQGGSVTNYAKGGMGGNGVSGYSGNGNDGQQGGTLPGSYSNVFGMTPSSPGFFSVASNSGGGGQPGEGGKVGFYYVNGGEGKPGSPSAGNGGYGAGGGAGGGGGGGGNGANGGGYGRMQTPAGAGGTGGPGAECGAPGFGGGGTLPTTITDPQTGSPANGNNGGSGGNGGDGVPPGGGAGFGGAIFVMDNATLRVDGAGTLSGGNAVGGTSINPGMSGAAAGVGAFLHGSGELTFSPDQNLTYTVSDQITDEQGLVATTSVQPVDEQSDGPDGLPRGGGHGSWDVTMFGEGTLALVGTQAFSGQIKIHTGSVDLSNYTSAIKNNLVMDDQTRLQYLPSGGVQEPQLYLSDLTISGSVTLAVNANTSILVNSILPSEVSAPTTIVIAPDPASFNGVTRQVQVVTTNQVIPPSVQLQYPPDFTVHFTEDAKGIVVART